MFMFSEKLKVWITYLDKTKTNNISKWRKLHSVLQRAREPFLTRMNFGKEDLTFVDNADPTFTVKIKDFHHNMKNWSIGRSISTQAFKVQDVDLDLQIYPNGANHQTMFRYTWWTTPHGNCMCITHSKLEIKKKWKFIKVALTKQR